MQTAKLKTWITRLAFVFVGLLGWYLTQAWIGQRELSPGAIGDGVHDWLAGANAYLHQHPKRTDQLLIASSAVIDLLGFFLLWRSVFGPSLRQVCQLLCALEPPPGMLWRDPGFPSLLVTYGVTTDFFFSGHTGLAVLGAVELARVGGRRWVILGVSIVVFEVMTVLVLRAHYTMDVFAGAVAARYATLLASRIAPSCDNLMRRLVGQETTQPTDTDSAGK
ncbi:MAG: phosphatase PAP2-related protein [Rubripirellula sp.]